MAGQTIPPKAARAGKVIFLTFDKWPSINSCLSSRPIEKKKIEIKPSLIHNKRGFISSKVPKVIPAFVFNHSL